MHSNAPPPWAAQEAHVIDPSERVPTFANILAHLTFTFGFFPRYAANNALPDWSIGLEMQFYMAFPFLVLLGRKYSWTLLTVIGLFVTLLADRYLGMGLNTFHSVVYPQPSLLPFKLNIFIGGMLLAEACLDRPRRGFLMVLAATSFYRSMHLPFAIGVLLLSFLLMKNDSQEIGLIDKPSRWLALLLSSKVGRFLGNTSFSVYLLHNLVLLLTMPWLFRQAFFTSLSPGMKMTVAAALTLPIIYGISFVIYKLVELPGIQFGKAVLRKSYLVRQKT